MPYSPNHRITSNLVVVLAMSQSLSWILSILTTGIISASSLWLLQCSCDFSIVQLYTAKVFFISETITVLKLKFWRCEKDEGEPCDHFCLNEKTHYECACQFNYELGPDLHSCHPIEEPPFIIGGHNEHPLLYTENFPAHTSPDRTVVHSIENSSTAKTSLESDIGSDSREHDHQDWFLSG